MDKALELENKYKSLLSKNGLTSSLRKAHFWAQLKHESNLQPVSENLNYSAQGLQNTFHKYFPTLELANSYSRQPQKIANRIYANRMGNGNESSGEGYKFRGRGFIQITGKTNYTLLSNDTRIDYLSNPDLLLNEADALISALWYWNRINGNKFADKDDILSITKAINGGTNGLKDRKKNLSYYKTIFN